MKASEHGFESSIFNIHGVAWQNTTYSAIKDIFESTNKDCKNPQKGKWDPDNQTMSVDFKSLTTRLREIQLSTSGLIWMRMYSSQSTCVEVDWSEIELNFVSFHSDTCGLRWIHMHPNKALIVSLTLFGEIRLQR